MQMTKTDGVRVIMPNSKVWGSKIDNYSLSKSRRMDLTLKVREDDLETAITTIEATLADDTRILGTPAPEVRVTSVGDDAATLSIGVDKSSGLSERHRQSVHSALEPPQRRGRADRLRMTNPTLRALCYHLAKYV